MATQDEPSIFTKLSSETHLYTAPSPLQGSLVILCLPIGAKSTEVSQFSAPYLTLAPNTRILLINPRLSVLSTSYEQQQKNMFAAMQVVKLTLKEAKEAQREPKILLHVVSSGGANAATQLLNALYESLEKPLPLEGIICDSAPADKSFFEREQVVSRALPENLVTWAFAFIISHQVVILLMLLLPLFGIEEPEALFRAALLDDLLVKGANDSPLKMRYISSKADEVADPKSIASHADLAKEKGWDVKQMEFEESEHCGHLEMYEKEYVGVIKELWAD